MTTNKIVAITLSLLLIALLTTAVMGLTSWIAFWVFALILFVYLKTTKK